ncbi:MULTISPECIES: helix-hairpin-helix domain-containing protein [Staphylococcus]|uniref:Helix-hairpin-helix domain-containing protein n=1 Tax=Staphylococcus hsinchuensis TaxID=3051183 RepID=A0ABZ3ED13_9STAP|nr:MULTISPECIES: helix-hairpin-helix domain-containing protein [unclassified Staphylococcus]
MQRYWEKIKPFILKYKLIIALSLTLVMMCALLISSLFNSNHASSEPLKTDEFNLNQTPSLASSTNELSAQQNKHTPKQPQTESQSTNDFIYVDIKGAVKKPDVYKMKATDRIKQLLAKAQAKSNADLSQVNLAEKLMDQKLVYIPKKGEQSNQISGNIDGHQEDVAATSNVSKSENSETINLNNATESDLMKVPGIGPVKAQAIIEYRDNEGSFNSVDQLTEIRGIGEKTLEKLRDYFTV